jgi:hypothetical protein
MGKKHKDKTGSQTVPARKMKIEIQFFANGSLCCHQQQQAHNRCAYNIITMFAACICVASIAFTFDKISTHEIPSTSFNTVDCQPDRG